MEGVVSKSPGGSTGICIVCSSPCTTSCGGCKKVSYCSRAHQQKHWKSHKSQCFPLVVEYDEVLGRHMVTTRDVKQGEILIKEPPLVSGPNGTNLFWPVCLGCFRTVQGDYICSKCKWPLCGPQCEKISGHKENECKIFSSRKIDPFIYEECFKYEFITVLRGVLHKDTNPNIWSKILELQSHASERNDILKTRMIRDSAFQFIKDTCGLKEASNQDIEQVLGSISTNAFMSDDSFSQPNYFRNGAYLYYMASMPAHNCVPNSSWVVQRNSDFHLRANVPLKCGESVTFLYTEPTLPTRDRQRKLKESKYFLCSCPRCSDPTELGTYFSAVKCPGTRTNSSKTDCIEGYLLPIDPLKLIGIAETGTDWACDKCGLKKSWDYIFSVLNKIDQEIGKVSQEDNFANVKKLEACLRRHSGTNVHPNHYKIHDIENDMVQRISYLIASNSNVIKIEEKLEWANKLILLSRKCLAMADVIWPGYSRHRGRLLYFLQQGIVLTLVAKIAKSKRAQKATSNNNINSRLLSEFEELLQIRQEIMNIFSIEPEGREETYLYHAVAQDSEDITLIKTLLNYK